MSLWYPCVYCTEDLKCTKYSDDEVTSYCLLGPCHDETKSNADRIRSMSDEELAKFMNNGCDAIPSTWCRSQPNCDMCWLLWLKAPVEVDE